MTRGEYLCYVVNKYWRGSKEGTDTESRDSEKALWKRGV